MTWQATLVAATVEAARALCLTGVVQVGGDAEAQTAADLTGAGAAAETGDAITLMGVN